MTTTPKVLIDSKLAEDVLTMQYGAVNCKASVDKFTATNVTASNVVLTVHLVPPGGTADATNQLPPQNIAPGKSWMGADAVGHIIDTGGAVWTLASDADAIAVRASGREFT